MKKETNTGMTKVKLAIRNEVNGLPCYEFRLNLGKIGSVRIAFTVYNDLATIRVVLYISLVQIYKNLPLPQRFNEYWPKTKMTLRNAMSFILIFAT